jgi:hypothetical protein
VAVLTLDLGGTPLTVACERGGHAAPRVVGNRVHGFAGVETSSVRAELMVVPTVLAPLSSATVKTIRDLFALGNQVTCEGDIFNRPGEQIICSGTITDELHEVGDRWTVNLTLYEVANADTGIYSPETTDFVVTPEVSDDDPGDGSIETMTIGGYGTAVCFRALDAESPPTCPYVFPPESCAVLESAVPERSFLTPPLAAGTASGVPSAYFVSKGINGGSGIWYQSTKAKLYHVRGGVDIGGPWESGYVSGSWGGGGIYFPFTDNLSLTLLDGDRLRLELWSRLSLIAGGTDPQPYVLARQTICYGGFWSSYFRIGGILEVL